jgi:hypothetical protein
VLSHLPRREEWKIMYIPRPDPGSYEALRLAAGVDMIEQRIVPTT